MTHNPDVLERLAPLSGAPSRGLEDLLRLRTKRQRVRKVGTIAVVTGLLVALGLGFGTIHRTTMPAPPASVQPSPSLSQRPPVEVTFPMLPDGARPSTPLSGDAVLQFRSWPRSYPVELAIYADGRVIWHPNRNDVGFFELRLTPAGVDSIRSMVTSTGLFDHDTVLVRPGNTVSRLSILRGDRWVFDGWADPSWWAGSGIERRRATASETRDLGELDRLLSDPSAWRLSSDLYVDPEIRPFVPSGFMLEYDRSDPDLSKLPPPIRELLARYSPGSSGSDESNGCNVVTAAVARQIVDALARAGYAPLANTPTYVDYNLPGSDGGPSNLHLSPVLPDPCWSHQ